MSDVACLLLGDEWICVNYTKKKLDFNVNTEWGIAKAHTPRVREREMYSFLIRLLHDLQPKLNECQFLCLSFHNGN